MKAVFYASLYLKLHYFNLCRGTYRRGTCAYAATVFLILCFSNAISGCSRGSNSVRFIIAFTRASRSSRHISYLKKPLPPPLRLLVNLVPSRHSNPPLITSHNRPRSCPHPTPLLDLSFFFQLWLLEACLLSWSALKSVGAGKGGILRRKDGALACFAGWWTGFGS